MRKFLLLSVLLMVAAGLTAAEEAPTIVIVLRHAEKSAGVAGPDPPLSEPGARRAQELVSVAAEAGVSAIYTTQFKRTQETARPLAARLNLTAITREVTPENAARYPATLAREILTSHPGRTVMVIGHSNTVPQIVEALGAQRPAPLDDATDFDQLFVVIVPRRGGPARVIKTRYGTGGAREYP